MRYHDSQLQECNRDCAVLADALALIKQRGFAEDEITRFTEKAVRILDKCAEHYGAGTQFQYQASRYLGRVRLRIVVQGNRYDPLTDEDTNNSVLDFVERAFLLDTS